MEKRYIIGAVLCFAALIAWQVWLAPKYEPPAPAPGETEAEPFDVPEPTTPAGSEAQGQVDRELETPSEPGRPAVEPEAPVVEATAEEQVTVDTDLYNVVLTNRGARVRSWTLQNYTGRDGQPLQAVPRLGDHETRLPLGVFLSDPGLTREINEALFRVERRDLSREEGRGAGTRIVFEWSDGRGIEVRKALEFRDGEYLVGVDLDVTDRGRRLPASLAWGPGFQTRQNGKGGLGSYYYANQALWNLGGKVEREKKIEEEIGAAGRLYWAGLEDQYFTVLILPHGSEGDVRAWPVEVEVPAGPAGSADETAEPPEAETRPMVAVGVGESGARIYVGPKNYKSLKEAGDELEKAVWFSSISLFAFMARILYAALLWIHAHIVPNYGVAIILTTLALRMVLFPLNQFSMVRIKKSQSEMQKLQPKINAIKNKYRKKKDAESRAQMNQETMALYKKEGINPMGGMMGCLPMLAQFPILIGFYDMLVAAIELRGAPFFGWIQDLTLKDPYYITPLLMGASMLIQQKMSATKLGDPAQQRIMMMTPVIFTVMFLNLPSGLVLYWFVNNLLGIGQQWLVNRHIGRLESASERA